MFNITLYTFNKKANSTKRPTAAGAVFPCNMKTSSSIINPVIEIGTSSNAILTYNYAYIQAFSRYYFVDNIVYDEGIFTLSLSVDVLASFKTDILNSSQFVLRSASSKNGNIIDNAYLTIADKTRKHADISTYGYDSVSYEILSTGQTGSIPKYFNVPFAQGDFVIGILGDNATGVDFYVFGYPAFKELINKAFTISPSGMTDVSQDLANAIYNPIQYIVSCKWFPRVPSQSLGSLTYDIKIGNQTITISAGYQTLLPDRIPQFEILFDEIPEHPASESYPYMNLSPFREINLYFQPFGNFPIDSSKVYKNNSLEAKWNVDYTVGISHLIISTHGTSTESDAILAETVSDYGVTIPISTLVTDWKTAAGASLLSYIGNSLEKEDSGHWDSLKAGLKGLWSGIQNIGNTSKRIPAAEVSTNKNLLSTAADILASANGQVKSSGNIGSFLSFNEGAPYIYTYYYYQTGHDNARFGSPLYEVKTLSELSGFTLCSNATVNYSTGAPIQSEADAIETALNAGVYIE